MEGGRNHRQELGRRGEDEACRFLESQGHTILERNWRSGHLEIDIISYDSAGIHFVEVKARQMSIQAPPQENVDTTKQRNIVNAAKRYLRKADSLPPGNHEYMFDVVGITFEGESVQIEWFPQAYIPIYV